MDPVTIISVMALISQAVKLGGEIVPIALRAYAAIKAESGMTDEELTAASMGLNDTDRVKLLTLLES